MFSVAVWAGDAEKLLCCCVNEAADWAAEGRRQLKHVLCAQDDALANLAEHAAKQLESQGDSYLSQGDKLLCQGSEGGIIDVLTKFGHAKAAYDEANACLFSADQFLSLLLHIFTGECCFDPNKGPASTDAGKGTVTRGVRTSDCHCAFSF